MNTRLAKLKNVGRQQLNWIRVACAVPLVLSGLGALASPVNDQPAADEVRQRVAAALHAQRYLDDRHITVSAVRGAIEIRGFVYSTADLVDALQTARASAGGTPVVDSLSIELEGRH